MVPFQSRLFSTVSDGVKTWKRMLFMGSDLRSWQTYFVQECFPTIVGLCILFNTQNYFRGSKNIFTMEFYPLEVYLRVYLSMALDGDGWSASQPCRAMDGPAAVVAPAGKERIPFPSRKSSPSSGLDLIAQSLKKTDLYVSELYPVLGDHIHRRPRSDNLFCSGDYNFSVIWFLLFFHVSFILSSILCYFVTRVWTTEQFFSL
jgi:hypothetical protein